MYCTYGPTANNKKHKTAYMLHQFGKHHQTEGINVRLLDVGQ